MEEKIKSIVAGARHILVLQADNPDADSLGSSLALEHILFMLGDKGKKVTLYCGVDIPGYLQYLAGWDRVTKELPKQFDAAIFVDASTYTLFEKLQGSGEMNWVKTRPSIILDHHGAVENPLDFATVTINDKASSTGEIVYHLAHGFGWPISVEAGEYLMTAILGDTQGLSNDLASPATYRVMAELVELGVNRPRLEELRREYSKMPSEIYRYKAKLIERTELAAKGHIALVTIPQHEINNYSPLYNPAPLIQGDMLNISGVELAIVMKQYDDGRITGAIRANNGSPVADKLATHLGGGGHPYASGFKLTNGRPLNEVKSECIEFATELLNTLDKERTHEAVQYADVQD